MLGQGNQARLDKELRRAVRTALPHMVTQSDTLPAYRFVDLYRAVEAYCAAQDVTEVIDAVHHSGLPALLFDTPHQPSAFLRIPATKVSWKTSPTTETSLPTDRFWVTYMKGSSTRTILRLRYDAYNHVTTFEVATGPEDQSARVLKQVIAHATEHSIYRGAMLALDYVHGQRNEYGDVERKEHLAVGFSDIQPVEDEEIILSSDQVRLLERNMIHLAERREILSKHGVPTKRGLLLHGPPGTGKTYACRYMCHRMAGVTRIFLTGSALSNVSAVFGLARLYQPAVVFIEDADLMFASREVNLHSTTLGELMDQMDGLQPSEQISIVMTTNAIDRIEAALKDRPGRISQCLYMGAPDRELRERFLTKQLADQDTSEVTMAHLVAESRGATQAFLKEWVYRSIQIATEDLDTIDCPLALRDRHFDDALAEMNSEGGEAGARIVGFATSAGTD